MSPKQLVLPAHIHQNIYQHMRATDIYTPDKKKFFDAQGNQILAGKPLVTGVTELFAACNRVNKKLYNSIDDFAVWVPTSLEEIFYRRKFGFDKYVISQNSGSATLIIRMINNDVFAENIKAVRIHMSTCKSIQNPMECKNDVITSYRFVEDDEIRRINQLLLGCNVHPFVSGKYQYFDLEHPWLYHLYYSCQKYMLTAQQHRPQFVNNYFNNYVSSNVLDSQCYPLKNWLEGKRIDGETQCCNPIQRQIPHKYQPKSACTADKCHCFNPLDFEPNYLRDLLIALGSVLHETQLDSNASDVGEGDKLETPEPVVKETKAEPQCPFCGKLERLCTCDKLATPAAASKYFKDQGWQRHYYYIGDHDWHRNLDEVVQIHCVTTLDDIKPHDGQSVVFWSPINEACHESPVWLSRLCPRARSVTVEHVDYAIFMSDQLKGFLSSHVFKISYLQPMLFYDASLRIGSGIQSASQMAIKQPAKPNGKRLMWLAFEIFSQN